MGLSNERPPVVDGEVLPDGYGVLIEQQEFLLDVMLSPIESQQILPPRIMRGWITKRNQKGEYEKYEEIGPQSVVFFRDDEGRAWEFEDGVVRGYEDKIDLDAEYGDE